MPLVLLNQGRAKLAQAFSAPIKPKVSSFELGTAAGFTPDPASAATAQPNILYSGSAANILKTIVTVNEVIFTVYLPYSLQLSGVGNILLRFDDNTPFLWLVLPQAQGKRQLDGAKHFAGDNHYKSMVLKFPNIANILNYTDNPDFYAQPGEVASLNDLVDASFTPTTEYFVGNTDHRYNQNLPTFAINIQNVWWGVPNMQVFDTAHPDYMSTLDGGQVGDSYGRVVP